MIRAMKDSGIAWIGEIPENWKIERLKNCFIKRDGGNWGEEANGQDGDCICLRIADFDYERFNFKDRDNYTIRHYDPNIVKKWYLKKDDIVIEKSGGGDNTPVGRTVIFDKNFNATFVNFTDRLRCSTNILPKYMQYVLVTFYKNRYSFNYVKQTTGIQNLDLTAMLSNEQTPFPPLYTQKSIVDFLDNKCKQIDYVLEKTRESIEEYKQLKNAVITHAVTKGIRSNRKMKDSGIEWIGEIPEEWEDINPKALFTQRKEKAKNGEKQLTASQQHGIIFQDEYMELTGARIVTVQKDFDILKHVEAGDFVISMRSFQGGLEYSTNTGSISSAYVMLIPNLTLVVPKFFKWLLKSELYINALQSTSNLVRDGQAMRYSNFAQIRLLKIPLAEQSEIADYLDKKCSQIDNLISKKEQLITELETYKKSLIYEYVTGKKEVK